MSYRILLAEDEQIVREGFDFLLDWDRLGCKIVKKVKDGNEAIEFLRSNPDKIDIVITDINMPILLDGNDLPGGLAVAKYIKDTLPRVQTVILTAYDNFSFAQNAIRFDVVDFVLKSDIDIFLPKAIEKAISEIESRNKDVLELEKAAMAVKKKKQENQYLLCMRSEALGVVSDSITSEDGRFLVLALEVNDSESGSGDCNCIRGDVQETFRSDTTIITFLSPRSCCILFFGSFKFADIRKQVIALRENLFSKAMLLLCASSHEVKNSDKISEATRSALDRLHTIRQDANWFLTNPLPLLKARTKTIAELTKARDYIEFKDLIDEYLAYDIGFPTLRLDMVKLVSALSDRYPSVQGKTDDQFISDIQYSQTRYRLRHIVCEYAYNHFRIAAPVVSTDNLLVKEALAYIKHNYTKPINLSMVANQLNVSDSYLGRTFKNEIGESLLHVLNELRIQFALLLLKNPSVKIFEVSSKSGFSDPNYFAHVFYRHTGMSPKEYQKKNTL
ncbi:response regulator containing CheY-like receiver domain and AraC-type DNA-binding domain [Sphaerochaeta pleomorpha str. Grapes]|uniref:Response regulator containing CheY-like receiver domain and AraC-type DNA-binding domain n=1 Tax=Sphaerochaeta pleomorpha (strain ATCC BAA-1885 / DSM 22778 / Grapes) TaxID=158190 RepID=G8QTE8_SPHPG|nr:helix-turn-helix domain-containing protein [Sphaerochaeta pleomorpha]AEV30189.1 response regulator containing CheY-like receiver domain and AraC-type DNA-binding domain [Sphaerochaeta pleomorpha str. Grapes]